MQIVLHCNGSGMWQAANVVHLTVVLCGRAYISSVLNFLRQCDVTSGRQGGVLEFLSLGYHPEQNQTELFAVRDTRSKSASTTCITKPLFFCFSLAC